eukprot:354857-Chlamydomonas_euryale.AAC.49
MPFNTVLLADCRRASFQVLTTPGTGILHCSEFGHLQWVTRDVEPAPLADVLRCHDYAYVKRIEDVSAGNAMLLCGSRFKCCPELLFAALCVACAAQACKELPPGPSAIGRLDMDTSISHDTYKAALVAAGATLKAVDEVMAGNVANVFCAVGFRAVDGMLCKSLRIASARKRAYRPGQPYQCTAEVVSLL